MTDNTRLKGIIGAWMEKYREQTGQPYIYWGDLASKIEEFIDEAIAAIPFKEELTDEAAVEQLKKSGWLDRHDAEVERRVSVNELINTVMARGDKSIRISIDPWRWED